MATAGLDGCLEDLLGVPVARVNDDRLYRALDALLPGREALFQHLQTRYAQWFGTTFDILLYDITSTFFEGRMRRNPQARRGYSRDGRPDCLQLCIGLIVTPDGLPVAYEVFDGNRTDVTTVEEVIETMRRKYGHDALQRAIRRPVRPLRHRPVVDQRIGRILQRYPRAARLIDITVTDAPCLDLTWEVRTSEAAWADLADGAYLLRTNMAAADPQSLWETYIRLTQVEFSFRVSKTDLGIRPVYHHTDTRAQAHILVCFLALVLWRTLKKWMSSCGLGTAPRLLLDELAQVHSMDVILPIRWT